MSNSTDRQLSMSQVGIAAALGITRQAVSHRMKTLIAKGLIDPPKRKDASAHSQCVFKGAELGLMLCPPASSMRTKTNFPRPKGSTTINHIKIDQWYMKARDHFGRTIEDGFVLLSDIETKFGKSAYYYAKPRYNFCGRKMVRFNDAKNAVLLARERHLRKVAQAQLNARGTP